MLALFPFLGKKPSKDELEIRNFLIQKFGYKIKSYPLFRKAFAHKSLIKDLGESNERLEFLGDAVLDAVIADYLFEKFPEEDEGYLTKVKSKMVSRRTLGQIGRLMDISSVMFYNRTRTIKLETIEGNAFEAIIGAIFLDGGYLAVDKSIKNIVFKRYIDLNQILEEEIDFKSKLFIWCQKSKVNLTFEVVEEQNLGSEWKYRVKTLINEKEYGDGVGSSKKKAEQIAAKETLELLGEI